MELQFINSQVKKRRIVVLVEEGLYDFTDDELKRIYESRDEEDSDCSPQFEKVGNMVDSGGQDNYQYGHPTGEFAESENSDTESALHDRLWDHFNTGFIEDVDHEHESVGMISSLSHSDFSEMESMGSSVHSPDGSGRKNCIRALQLSNSVEEMEQSSVNKIDNQSQNSMQKKLIVPEPWLSDTNYYIESDESFEEQNQQKYHHTRPTESSIRNKISSFGHRWLPNLLKYSVK